MISAVQSFRVTKPRMIQRGGACSTRGTDEKCTDHEGKWPTKTSLKEHRAWSSQCVNQVQGGTVVGYIKWRLSDCQLLQKDCALQCWSFNYVWIEILTEEKPLWLIYQYRNSISLSRDIPLWPSSCCVCLHCCIELAAAVCYQCASKLNKLNYQQRFVTSVVASWTNWTASISLLPVCKHTKQTELAAAVCYQCANTLNKLNYKQQFVTSVQAHWTNWTGSSSLLAVW